MNKVITCDSVICIYAYYIVLFNVFYFYNKDYNKNFVEQYKANFQPTIYFNLLFLCLDEESWQSRKSNSAETLEKSSTYSVMQSDRNSFCGDVILGIVYLASREKTAV